MEQFSEYLVRAVSLMVLLGVLIFIHELGHFLVAKWLGIKVERFSLGFGPIIYRWGNGETEYALSSIPLGGYVKMYGENPGEITDAALEKRSFSARPAWQRTLVVAAGPLMNFLLAFFVFAMLGMPNLLPVVGNLTEGFPAQSAGIQVGDRLLSVGGEAVDSWETMAEAIAKAEPGLEIEIIVEREGVPVHVMLTPVFRQISENAPKRVLIGIGPKDDEVFWPNAVWTGNTPLWRIPVQGYEITVIISKAIFQTVWKLLTAQKDSHKEVGSLFTIADYAGQAVMVGLDSFLFMLAGLSLNLAILNLLPIPVLDGGHLFFFLIEMVRGRPVSVRYREIAQQFGLLVLLTLMALVLFIDFTRYWPF